MFFVLRFVKKKFEELYFQSTAPDRVDRVFKIYRTTALDQKLVKKTFKLVDETLRRRNLFEAGLLWSQWNFKNWSINTLKSFRFIDIGLLVLYPEVTWFGSFRCCYIICNLGEKKEKKTIAYWISWLKNLPIFFFQYEDWQSTFLTLCSPIFIICKWGDLAVNHIDFAPYAIYMIRFWKIAWDAVPLLPIILPSPVLVSNFLVRG